MSREIFFDFPPTSSILSLLSILYLLLYVLIFSPEKISLSLSRATGQVSNTKAFTLVELMIVIAIIGVLAASLFPMMSNYMTKAKIAAMKVDAKQMTAIIQGISNETGQKLTDVTGSFCSECACRGFNVRPDMIDTVSTCAVSTKNFWNKVQIYWSDVKNPWIDPWGGIYLMNENFLEGGVCMHDTLVSAGANNIRELASDENVPITSSEYIGNIYETGTHDILVELEYPYACPQ